MAVWLGFGFRGSVVVWLCWWFWANLGFWQWLWVVVPSSHWLWFLPLIGLCGVFLALGCTWWQSVAVRCDWVLGVVVVDSLCHYHSSGYLL